MSTLQGIRRRISCALDRARVGYRDQLSTTTRFFRNYGQLLTVGRTVARVWSEGAALSALHVGGSVGCEALSLLVAMEETQPSYDLRSVSTDVDAGVLACGQRLEYDDHWFEPILGEGGDPGGLRGRWFVVGERDGRRVWRPRPQLASRVSFAVLDITRPAIGTHADLVLCQNVLIHMTPRLAARSLRHALSMVRRPGVFVCGGMDLDLRALVVEAGFAPVTDSIDAIHDGWVSHRTHFREHRGTHYFELEDLDRSRPDWPVRYASIFVRPGP